jgi:hypothetical protein
VRTDTRNEEETIYNIFENNRLGGFETPSYTGKQMAFTYGFSNLFEAKIFSKRDSTDKKIPIFRSLNIGGNYNFAADSLNWSIVSVSGNTSFFNGITTFRFNANFDPYERNPQTGARTKQTYLDSRGRLLRFDTYSLGVNTNMTVGRLRDLIKGINTDQRVANQPPTPSPEEGLLKGQDLLSLFEDFTISHNFTVQRRFDTRIKQDTTVISANSVNTRGHIQLTDNWSITVGNIGYDFQSKELTYPDFGFYRDLHCWELGFNWQPHYGTYSFYLKVKPGKLDFINIPYRKNIQDRSFGGF